MKTKTYTLSVQSLDALMSDLKAYLEDFKDKEQQFLEQLAETAKNALETAYNSSHITVTYEPFQDGAIHGVNVIAGGKGIGFIEFGAGVYAGEGSEFKDNAPFEVYPGSWSENHAQTYQEWVKNGQQGEYRYNRQPANAFPQAYAILKNSAHTLAREIFGDKH